MEANYLSNVYYALYHQYVGTIVHEIRRRKIVTAIIAILIAKKYKKRQYRKKRHWISPFLKERRTKGAFYTTFPSLLEDSGLFVNYCRMSKTQFEELLLLVAAKITKIEFLREPISAPHRLLLTLR